MEAAKLAILLNKIGAIINNPANIFNRPASTRNYIKLANRQAERLLASGHKEQADHIWKAIAPYYELTKA